MEKEIISLPFLISDFIGKRYTDNDDCPVATVYKRIMNVEQVSVTNKHLYDHTTRPATKYTVFYGNKEGFSLDDYLQLVRYFSIPKFWRNFVRRPILSVDLIKN